MIPFCACLGFVVYASVRAWVRAFAARILRGHGPLPDGLSRRARPDQDIRMPDLSSIRRQSSERLPDTHPAPSVVNVARQPSLVRCAAHRLADRGWPGSSHHRRPQEMRSSTPRTTAAAPPAAATAAAATSSGAAADAGDAAAPAAARDPNATTWACPACTYTNPVSETQCGMCQSDRP